MRFAIAALALYVCAPSLFGQISADEAMARLKERQARAATRPAETRPAPTSQPVTLNSELDRITLAANEFLSHQGEPTLLTSAQREETEQRIGEFMIELADGLADKKLPAALSIDDVKHDYQQGGALVTLATVGLPHAKIPPNYSPPEATIHLTGDDRMLKWRKGQSVYLPVITIRRIVIGHNNTRQRGPGVRYVGQIDVYAELE